MKPSKKRLFAYIALAIVATIAVVFASRAIIYRPIECDKWQEGMVILHESKSQQSPLIKAVTASRWTHCGIVVRTSEGLKVLEASKMVRLVPIEEFCKRGKGGDYIVCLPRKRHSKPISYKIYLGQPYDLSFKFDNGKMYCSELVWLVYKEQGIQLCEPRKVGDFFVVKIAHSKLVGSYKKAKWLRDLMKKRNITLDQYAVAPSDLAMALSAQNFSGIRHHFVQKNS